MRPVGSKNPIDIMNIKLKRFKIFFKGWGSNNFGKARLRRKWLREELGHLEKLQETDTLSPELYCKKVDLEVELNNLLMEEEISWLQKSHDNWLLKGDSNTGYFHRILLGGGGETLLPLLAAMACLLKVMRVSSGMLQIFIKNYLARVLGTCVG
uniref:Uncharacterized protein n=1 Tax=Hordeum vulgare subsp. vulgare TaxID=112509 RepID=A0A8I6WKD6_HORVV